jgi:hypothetical protein
MGRPAENFLAPVPASEEPKVLGPQCGLSSCGNRLYQDTTGCTWERIECIGWRRYERDSPYPQCKERPAMGFFGRKPLVS